MQIVYHLGAHCTDEERLLRCLLKNRGALAQEGIIVPGPAKYRTLLRDTAMALKGDTATHEIQALVLDQILEDSAVDRLILSWDNFLGYAQGVLRGGLYSAGAERMFAFCQILPGAQAEFHLAIRNPATFIPAVYQKQHGRSYDDFIDGVALEGLRWSTLVANLRRTNPNVPITVWCDEDTPLLWPDILQAVSGHSDAIELTDTDDLLASIMSDDGMARMKTYMDSHPPQSIAQRRRVVSAFLDKFARPDQVDFEIELDGWSPELVDRMSAAYDQDVADHGHGRGDIPRPLTHGHNLAQLIAYPARFYTVPAPLLLRPHRLACACAAQQPCAKSWCHSHGPWPLPSALFAARQGLFSRRPTVQNAR